MNYNYEHPRPAVTTDAVIFNLMEDDKLNVLLIQRKNEPFKGQWALPGGFIEEDETLEQCVEREIKEETGLEGIKFYHLKAFSKPDRDPRHRIITIAYWGFSKKNPVLNPSSDAAAVEWFGIDNLPSLAFDHEDIIKKALVRALEIMAK